MSVRSYPSSTLIAYEQKAKNMAFNVNASAQVYIYNVRAFNNSGSTANVGLCRRLIPDSGFKLYNFTSPTLTDITDAVVAGTATTLFSGTNNDGFYVQANHRFNIIGLTVSTGQTGGTFTYSYWNGTSFTALTTLEVPAYTTAADIYVVFQAPRDWVVGNGGVTGLNNLFRTIRVLSTTAPGGAVSVNNVWVAQFLELYLGVANNAGVQLAFPDTKPYVMQGGEGLLPYFSVTNATNQFGAYYSVVV